MRIELPTIVSQRPMPDSHDQIVQVGLSFHSSMEVSSARRSYPPFRAAWLFVKKMISSFFAKIFSWFHYQEEKPYFKMKDSKTGEVTFYVCKDGRRTVKKLTFGLTKAHLSGISFSDLDLRKTLLEIIDREQIDQIIVTSIRNAKMVWDCGLKTATALVFKPAGQDPFNKRLLEMLKCAFKKPSPAIASLLLNIQKEMVVSVITDAIAPIANALIVPDQADKIDVNLANAKIEKLGNLIGHPIDMEGLLKSVEKDEYLRETIEKIKEASKARQQVPFYKSLPVVSRFVAKSTPVENQPVSLDGISLSFPHIFALMDATKLDFGKMIIPKLPEIIFTT